MLYRHLDKFFPKMHFLTTLIFLFVFLDNCNKIISMAINRTISLQQPAYFEVTRNDSTYGVNVTLLDIKSLYLIYQNYDFFIPKVNAQCECSCFEGSITTCGKNTHQQQRECASLVNSTTTCTVYNKEVSDEKLCKSKYKICCTVYNTKYSVLGKHVGVDLKYHRTLYNIQVKMKDPEGGLKTEIMTVSDGLNNILLSPDIILKLTNLPRLHLIEDGWYFTSVRAVDLYKSSQINGRFSENLHQMGWFKQKDGKLNQILQRQLEKNFKVEMVDCMADPPIYKWQLNATGFYHKQKENIIFPPDAVSVVDDKNISDVALDLAQKIIHVKGENLLNMNVSSMITETFLVEANFLFLSNITIMNNKKFLAIKFIQGFGDYIVEVSLPSWIINQSFPLIIEKTTLLPQIYTNELHLELKEPPWVCIKQANQKLCEMSKIYNESNEAIPSSTRIPIEYSTLPTSTEINDYYVLYILLAYIGGAISCIFIYLFSPKLVKRVLRWKKWNLCTETRQQTDREDVNETLLPQISIDPSFSLTQTGTYQNPHTLNLSTISVDKLPPFLKQFMNKLRPQVLKSFGRQVGLAKNLLDKLTNDAEREEWSFEKQCTELLKSIQAKFPDKFNELSLNAILEECEAWEQLEQDPVTTLREELESSYRNNKPPYFPWMGNIELKYEDLFFELTEDQQHTIEEDQERFPVHEIFTEEDQTRQKILIQGKPGCGKTCLLWKIAYDWATSKQYMSRFHLIFVVHLRMMDSSLTDFIKKLIGTEKASKLVETIKTVEDRTLFLLDGFDELQQQSKKSVLDFLNGKLFPKANFILTSRTGILQSKLKELSPDISRSVFKKMLQIQQMERNNQELFLLKHVFANADIHKATIKTISEQTSMEMRECPLFLLMIGAISKQEGSTLPSNKVELYAKICNFISKIWAEKNNVASNMISLYNDESLQIVEPLIDFGKCALKCLEEDKMVFSKNDISKEGMEEIVSLGIFYKNQTNAQSGEIFYEPIHKSFLEFLAAVYLYKLRYTKDFNETIQSLKNFELFNFTTSMLFSFLFGLLNQESVLLLKILKPLAYHYSFDLNALWNEIKNCDITIELIDTLEPFIPVEWNVLYYHHESGFSLSYLHPLLLERGLQKEKITLFRWNAFYACRLPEQFHVKKIDIGACNEVCQSNIELGKTMKCEELNFDLLFENEILLNKEWPNCMNLINNINSKWVSIEVRSLQEKSCELLLWELQTGVLLEKNIRNVYIKCFPHHTKSFGFIIKVTEEKLKERLFVVIEPCLFEDSKLVTNQIGQRDVDLLVSTLSKNPTLKEFVFINLSGTSFSIDINVLTDVGRKHYNVLWFEGVILTDKGPQERNSIVRAILVYDYLFDTTPMQKALSKHTNTLGGYLNVIDSITRNMPEFDFSNITELEIVITNDIFQKDYFLIIKKFRNLRELSLAMTPSVKNHLFEDAVKNIISVIQDLKLEVLEVSQNKDTFPFAFALVEKLVQKLLLSSPSSAENSLFTLKSFRLKMNVYSMEESNTEDIHETLHYTCAILQSMKAPLQQKRLGKCSFLIHGPYNLRRGTGKGGLLLAEIYPIEEGFRIEWDVDGREDGNTRNKTLFSHSIHVYRITATFSD